MTERQQALSLIDEACASGARIGAACDVLGVTIRTVQRWKIQRALGDQRRGPRTPPKNKLTKEERAKILKVVNQRKYRNLSPKQIVPQLADRGTYLASESTIYRVLREVGQLKHRSPARPAERYHPPKLQATGPNQVYSWDITYLKSPVKGEFYYLYLVMDIWSRKIVGWSVESEQLSELAAELMVQICVDEGIGPNSVKLHADNGGPMKGATMLATLQKLGIVPSFNRPGVSNDNPFSESLFGTMKYRPAYPRASFESITSARAWVREFVHWYNERHLHSGLRFVTPSSRHQRQDEGILEKRRALYEQARRAHPERWSGAIRNWDPVGNVVLNGHVQLAVQAKQAA